MKVICRLFVEIPKHRFKQKVLKVSQILCWNSGYCKHHATLWKWAFRFKHFEFDAKCFQDAHFRLIWEKLEIWKQKERNIIWNKQTKKQDLTPSKHLLESTFQMTNSVLELRVDVKVKDRKKNYVRNFFKKWTWGGGVWPPSQKFLTFSDFFFVPKNSSSWFE